MTVRVYFKEPAGAHKDFTDASGYSVFRGKLYIWRPGPRKGKKPRATYNLSKLRKQPQGKGWEVL
jgi:hypothetical protein